MPHMDVSGQVPRTRVNKENMLVGTDFYKKNKEQIMQKGMGLSYKRTMRDEGWPLKAT